MKRGVQHGFALPLAALAVALLSLGLIMSAPASDQLARELRHARARLTLERAAISAETRIAFMLLTEPTGSRGIIVGGVRLAGDGSLISATLGQRPEEIVFDGRPYSFWLDASTEVTVRVQEKSGLINITEADGTSLANLLKICGKPASEAGRLAAKFLATRREHSLAVEVKNRTTNSSFLQAWSANVGGDRQRRLNAAISVLPAGTGVHLPTAPPSVILALFGGNEQRTRQYIALRNGVNISAKMTQNYDQFDYKLEATTVTRKSMTGIVGIVVTVRNAKLTIGSPLYFYESGMKADLTNLQKSFYPIGQNLHAGRPVQCYQPSQEVAQPLPGGWLAER